MSRTLTHSTPPLSDGTVTILAAALFGLCTLAMTCGCTPRRASLTPIAEVLPGAGPREAGEVEVLLDRKPDKPFTVVGELHARAIESPAAIERMREEAARAGLDGIYWIECAAPGSGACTAKGYVYERPGGPDTGTTVAAK